MANANIAIVTTNKTFDEWRVATNDLIADRNILRNSDYVKDNGNFTIANGKLQISRTAGGTTLTNDNDALIGGLLTTTDLTVIDDVTIGGNASMISANARLTVNNNVYTRNLDSNSLITAANVVANGYVTVLGAYRDSQNNILNINSTLYMSNSGAVNVGNTFSANDLISANKTTGTGLYVLANTVLNGNLSVGTNAVITGNISVFANGAFSKNIAVDNWINGGNLSITQQANLFRANIITANIATLNVNASGAIANVANLRVANSNTVNAYIQTLAVGDPISSLRVTTLNVTTVNVSSLINASAANVATLEVGSLSVRDPIIAPSESDSATYRLRVSQTTRGDGSFGVRLGSAANGNAWITFDTLSGNVWRLTSNSTEGSYSTILTAGNIVTSVTSTSTINVPSASALKTAYDHAESARAQANTARDRANTAFTNAGLAYDAANNAGSSATIQAAYAAANSAANTTRVSANSGSSLSARQLNFINTSTVTVAVSSAPDGNANISFISTGGGSSAETANAANTVAIYANNALVYANANVNFNNTSTVNVSVTQNVANKRANIDFSVNLTAIGIPSITAGFATVNTNIDTANTQANQARNTANVASSTATLAYAAANSAANTVRVSANSGSTLTSRQLNFVNTSSVSVSVSANPDGTNANISFTAAAATPVTPGGSTKQVQFNNGGAFGGASDLNYDSATQRVGIGTASPYKKLEVVGGGLSVGPIAAGSSQLGIELGDLLTSVPSSQVRGIIGVGDSSIGLAGDMIYQPRGDVDASHRFAIKGSEVFRIQYDGRVGIGVSNPDSFLTVKSTTGKVGFNYGSLSSPVRGNMYYDTDGSGWNFQIGKLQGGVFTSQMTFADNGTVTIPTITSTSIAVTSMTVNGVSVRDGSILNSGTVAAARLPGNMLRHVTSGYVGGNVFVTSVAPTAGAVGDIWIEI